MSVPKLRFPGFDGEWQEVNLTEVCTVNNGGTPDTAKSEYWGGPINWFSPSEFKSKYLFESIQKITEEGLIRSATKLIPIGSILLSARGTVGEVSINALECCINQSAMALIPTAETNSEFLYYTFIVMKRQLTRLSAGSTFSSINKSEVEKLHVLLPSMEEQKKIAEFLSAVDEKIELLSRKKALLEKYKKGVMQKLFSQQLRFKDDNGNTYPEWEEKKIVEIAEINMGQSPPSDSYGIEQIGYPLIQGNADIDNRKTSPRQWTTAPTKLCDIGDIILTVRAPVGAVSLSHHNACIGRGVCSIKSSSQVHSIYLYLWFILFENKWDSIAQGSTFTAINRADIESLGTPFPCLEEQKKIADFLSSIDEKIELVGKQIEGMKLYKKGLLQQMFV